MTIPGADAQRILAADDDAGVRSALEGVLRFTGFDFGRSSHHLHVCIGHLRRKTAECGGPRLIHTVRGVGCALREEPA